MPLFRSALCLGGGVRSVYSYLYSYLYSFFVLAFPPLIASYRFSYLLV